jgi:S-formylglutathione hydrolase FrmB
MILALLAFFQLQHKPAQSGRLVTDSLWSQSLGIYKHAVIWLPPSYDSNLARRYPVAYYLHGAFGDETNWTKLGKLDATLDSLTAAGMKEMIVVMPDGDDGWYTTWNFLGDYPGCRRAHADSTKERAATYCVPWPKYDDYIARDLVAHVDRTYRTRADRAHRGIAGLSMGGYGAITLALAYPDVFSAAASHSGVLAPLVGTAVPPDSIPRYASAVDSLRGQYREAMWPVIRAAFGADTAAWWARDPGRLAMRLLTKRPALAPRLMIDCGNKDQFLLQNRALKSRLDALGWPVVYHEWPGAHTWDYWRTHAAESAQWLSGLISVP